MLIESFQIKARQLLTEELPEAIESSNLVSHRARMSGEFVSRKDSHPSKFDCSFQILVKLSFREFCDSKLSVLHTFDYIAISLS